ncbi:MAG: class I SAM-dependent RNA methyltransferase [Spirochaetaceae bacterium]|nr:class I SAM-dependent RNA methyltransferase [Spirochaetaceae bacterium]
MAKAEKIFQDGNCLVKAKDNLYSVAGVIPEEIVEIEETHPEQKTATLIKILEESPYRIQNSCPYYGICGGCTMRHINEEYQRKLRCEMLLQMFAKFAIEIPDFQCHFSNSDGYRCRMQLNSGSLRERGTNNDIPIQYCPVATPQIQKWLNSTPLESRPFGRTNIFGDIRLQNATEGLCIATENKKNDISYSITGKTNHKIKNKVKKRYYGTVSSPENKCTVKISATGPGNINIQKNISFDVRGFFQSNMTLLEKTITLILNASSPYFGGKALDIYSGSGTFSTFLGEYFTHITMVEHNRDALVYAEENMANYSHESFGLSGTRWANGNNTKDFQLALVDPPRSGIEIDVLHFFSNSKIPAILSLSCNPVTQARDCNRLTKAGYKLKKLHMLDFYPQTGHIESLAILEHI